MSERKLQNKYVPLRVRLRSPAEQVQWEHENLSTSADISRSHAGQANTSEAAKRTQQIKELVRLSKLLRADLGLNEVLQQVATSLVSCTGFRMLTVNLIDEQENYIYRVAFAGMSEEDEKQLRASRDPVEKIVSLMRPDFRISQSYFIAHEHTDTTGKSGASSKTVHNNEAGSWHPDDILFVPLLSPCEQKLLGFLSLDDPEDGRIPSEENIEVAELFANQAAIAIDNARLFREHETERIALEEGITQLRTDLEPIRHGDLRNRLRPTHPKLQPVADAINTMTEEISSILGNMQQVIQSTEEHTRRVQRNCEFLVRDTSQQERQINQISKVINDFVEIMHQVAERMTSLSHTAVDTVEVTNNAQETMARASEGMSKVREATMQSGRTMKLLGERGQGISEAVLEVSDLGLRLHHLALNAAIESTRAGEYGKGFSTIAQEIRTLAVGNAEVARNIEAYIRTIQNETNAASHSVEQNTQHVVMQSELVTQTGVALEIISEMTDQLTKLIEGIHATVENQTQGSQLVVNSVDEILRTTVNTNQHMREIQQSMGQLMELTNSLRRRGSVFRIGNH